jgi:hypothetical protein
MIMDLYPVGGDICFHNNDIVFELKSR